MTLKTTKDIETFKNYVQKCEDDVWLRSNIDNYNLKSALSWIVAIGRVISGDKSLELFATSKKDERELLKMFQLNPQML